MRAEHVWDHLAATMTIDSSAVSELLAELSAKRRAFCSEMDFQLHLAWQMKARGWQLALEYDPGCFESNAAIDVLVFKPEMVAFELKYKTSPHETEFYGQPFRLKNQGAQDVSRYDFLIDVWRLETVVAKGRATRGFAIFLTNDAGYWKKGRDGTADQMFRISEGRSVAGELHWGPTASAGTMKGREKPIPLTRDYVIGWRDYSRTAANNGLFRSLLVQVEPQGQKQ